ncbi:hypothetical protein ACHHYP_04383 [Achlya hypogyna]|uniref:Uncharacterized protein n=1 Tax=Achlya hypogyna TaxID=1202772 RepID=A0A1V9Z1I3_ACHHY|nr:hypothetical protein ACHHYP_04383 [Achlya hypogyna]
MTDANRDVLFLRVRTLEKYKNNYELLCSQLSELNTQVGLQLQRHEMDVAALQAVIRGLEKEKTDAIARILELESKAAAQAAVMAQDKEYTDRIHQQLTTAADLLKASERSHIERDKEYNMQMDVLHRQLEDEARAHDLVKRELATLKASPACDDSRASKASRADNRALAKENKRLKRKLDEAHQSLEHLRRQMLDECRRRDVEFEATHQVAQRRIAQLQQDALCLSDIASASKAQVQSLELQLDALETQQRKSHVREEELRRELDFQGAHQSLDADRLRADLADRDGRVKILEAKVRELKVRWKQDREHLKAKLQAHTATTHDADKLRQQVCELETQLLVADKRARLLEREIATLRDVLDEATLAQERRTSRPSSSR